MPALIKQFFRRVLRRRTTTAAVTTCWSLADSPNGILIKKHLSRHVKTVWFPFSHPVSLSVSDEMEKLFKLLNQTFALFPIQSGSEKA
jgi:hypothetical protein